MKVTYWLIVTYSGVRVVKRRPRPAPGEWIVRLLIDYPPIPEPAGVEVVLPEQESLALVETAVEVVVDKTFGAEPDFTVP